MNFKLDFQIPKANFTIQHGERMLFLGSCFSDEIAEKAKFHGLKVKSNHFGTVFHPSVLSRFIIESIQGIKQERILNRSDIFLSWDANSTVFDFSEKGLSAKLNGLQKKDCQSYYHQNLIHLYFLILNSLIDSFNFPLHLIQIKFFSTSCVVI